MLPARNLRTAYPFRRLAAPLAVALAIAVFSLKPLIANAAQSPVDLGTADSFAVLAGQGVTKTLTGFTVIDGPFNFSTGHYLDNVVVFATLVDRVPGRALRVTRRT